MDLRTPCGWFFFLLGAILVVTAIAAPERRAPLTDVNINLYSGLFMLAFGMTLLWLVRRSKARG
jgi:hypothetical protein